MKKLMFAMAAVAAGAVFAEGEIVSANIVGYMNNGDTVQGLNLLGAGFQDVGYGSIKLNSLKVENAEGGAVGSGQCIIQTIDANGEGIGYYQWKSSGKVTKTWSWKTKAGAAVSDDVVFARGLGVLFTGENVGDKLMSSGQVDLTACTNGTTVAGLNIIANPYPVTVKLNELKVKNAEDGDVGSGQCIIQTIDANGEGVGYYQWKSSGKTTKTWGWKTKAGAAVTDDVVLEAGDAILFTAENNGDKLIFPAK